MTNDHDIDGCIACLNVVRWHPPHYGAQ